MIVLIYKNHNKELAMLENEGDREARQRIEQARQERGIELDLRGLKLRELPEAIASLTNLRVLYLSNNQLRELDRKSVV